MKKIGILTFHASHNFGSMLQAFALQKTLQKMGHKCDIINFRSKIQVENCSGTYNKPIDSLYGLLRKLSLLPFSKDLVCKYNKFEKFLTDDLCCTNLFSKEEQVLEEAECFDFYICGSDQIWNSSAKDFSWLYFLPFSKGKKISYACSAGDKILLPQDKEKMIKLLSSFSAISVREQKLSEKISSLLQRKIDVVLDPTLLFTAEEWINYIDKEPIVKGDYLLVYSPYFMPKLLKEIPIANKTTGIVICSPMSVRMLYNPHVIKQLNTGPWDFLNLIYHSKGVISGSFHASVFAKLFSKPLFCTDMGSGSRIENLQNKFKFLEQERSKSLQFLREALK